MWGMCASVVHGDEWIESSGMLDSGWHEPKQSTKTKL